MANDQTLKKDMIAALPEDLKTLLEDYLIDENRMEQGDRLGEGNFGEVYKGTLADLHDPSKRDKVAIKTLKDGRTEGLTKFLQEAVIMKGFDHNNVLSLIGVVIKDSYTYILLPYMDEGDLQTYVSKARNRITPKQLIELTHQVAKGMDYLAKRKVVHRDLAARNCLVNSAGLVKVADFGLTRDIAVKDYYRTTNRELPYKWMALESLKTLRFDAKSDVWSFGVLMWETMSYGAEPYGYIYDFHNYLKKGNRLEKPQSCSYAFYAIMQKCWLEEPAQRPTFSQLTKEIEDVLKQTESSSGDIPTSLTSILHHKLEYKASWNVGFSYDNDVLLVDEDEPNLLRLFHFDGKKYSQTWEKAMPTGMNRDCEKAISTDGEILLQVHVYNSRTVRYNRHLQMQEEYEREGDLLDCSEHRDIIYGVEIGNTYDWKIEVCNPRGTLLRTLQLPAGQSGWEQLLSTCTTRSRIVVTETETRSLDMFTLTGEHVLHLDLPYDPATCKAVTRCGSGDYVIIAAAFPLPDVHVHNVLTGEEAATFSYQQLGLSKDEYLYGVRFCDGVLHIATGSSEVIKYLHAYKVNFPTSDQDQEESAPGASHQSTTSDTTSASTSNTTVRTARKRQRSQTGSDKASKKRRVGEHSTSDTTTSDSSSDSSSDTTTSDSTCNTKGRTTSKRSASPKKSGGGESGSQWQKKKKQTE